MAPGARKTVPLDQDAGLHCHVRANVTFTAPPGVPVNASITMRAASNGVANNVDVNAGSGSKAGADPGTIVATVHCDSAGNISVSLGGSDAATCLANGPDGRVALDMFVDGPLTELFVNGGERSLTNGGRFAYVPGTNLFVTSDGGTADVDLAVWAMSKSIA